jgi:hypothetical protein
VASHRPAKPRKEQAPKNNLIHISNLRSPMLYV